MTITLIPLRIMLEIMDTQYSPTLGLKGLYGIEFEFFTNPHFHKILYELRNYYVLCMATSDSFYYMQNLPNFQLAITR